MKKVFSFWIALVSAMAAQAQSNCSDILFSEYVEGWNNNKAIELYNPTNHPITLDNQYRLIRWANGSSASDQDPLYVLPLTGTISSYTTWVIIQDTTKAGQDTMIWPELRKKANWLAPYDYGGTTPGGNVLFWNGDDAISLQKKQSGSTWTDLDIFGEIGVRPMNWLGTYNPSGAWTDTKPYILGQGVYLTKSRTLTRKHNILHGVDRQTMIHYGDSTTGGIPNSFYALREYDTLPVNFFDSLGSHRCDCYILGSQQINTQTTLSRLAIYPNPASGWITVAIPYYPEPVKGFLSITTAGGRLVHSQIGSGRKTRIDISSYANGLYLLKVVLHDQVMVEKIIKQ
ncbi:MAG: T9SS type A sorting domain-containing protein [Bacteroidota bacterium]